MTEHGDEHKYCRKCGECIICNLRPCREGPEHTPFTEEQERLQAAFGEALERVVETDSGYDLAGFTNLNRGVAGIPAIEEYLNANRDTLPPEEVHFLEVTIALRKAFVGC